MYRGFSEAFIWLAKNRFACETFGSIIHPLRKLAYNSRLLSLSLHFLESTTKLALIDGLRSSPGFAQLHEFSMSVCYRHEGVLFFYAESRVSAKVLRVVSLATNAIVMLFIQSITYNLTNPDDGSCALLHTQASCLQPKSPAYSRTCEGCYWILGRPLPTLRTVSVSDVQTCFLPEHLISTIDNLDDQQCVYLLICNPHYPQRCAHMCLGELQRSVRNVFTCFDLCSLLNHQSSFTYSAFPSVSSPPNTPTESPLPEKEAWRNCAAR